MSKIITRDIMLESNFVITGKNINEKYNKPDIWIKKNALRELNQKRIKNNREIIKMKNDCLIQKGLWKCPHCFNEVKRLTCAHTGVPVSKLIDNILHEYPDENDICKLDKIVQEVHSQIIIIICCDKCNSLLDDSKK